MLSTPRNYFALALRSACSLVLLCGLSGCGQQQSQRIQGVWSNSERGQVLDITPSGLCAEVWLESQAQLSAWELKSKGELTLRPLCSSLAEKERISSFSFQDDFLAFPGKGGRFVGYVQEQRQTPPDLRLVGLWSRETKSHEKELLEFTPWSTVVWNRWSGKLGSEKLHAGWASVSKSGASGLALSGVEDTTPLRLARIVDYQVSTTTLTLELSAKIGSKKYHKTSIDEVKRAANSSTR